MGRNGGIAGKFRSTAEESRSDQVAATSGSSRTSRCKWLSSTENAPTTIEKMPASPCGRLSNWRNGDRNLVCDYERILVTAAVPVAARVGFTQIMPLEFREQGGQ